MEFVLYVDSVRIWCWLNDSSTLQHSRYVWRSGLINDMDHRTAIGTDIDVKWPSLCCRDTRFWGVCAQVLGLLSPQGTTEAWIGLPQYRHFISTCVWACGPDLINDCKRRELPLCNTTPGFRISRYTWRIVRTTITLLTYLIVIL